MIRWRVLKSYESFAWEQMKNNSLIMWSCEISFTITDSNSMLIFLTPNGIASHDKSTSGEGGFRAAA